MAPSLAQGPTFASDVCLHGGHKAPHYHPTREISGKLILNKVKEVILVTAS